MIQWWVSIQDVFDIAHSVQDADDLNWLREGVVYDQVGINRPKLEWPGRKILTQVPDSRVTTHDGDANPNLV